MGDEQCSNGRSDRTGDGADRAPNCDRLGDLVARNVCSTSASDDGTKIAAPTASTISAPISSQIVGARPHSIDPTVNTITPIRNIRRRPTRSARRPNGISVDAKTSVYAVRTQATVSLPALANVSLIAGNVTNPTVVSRKTANTARLVDTSTTHGLWCPPGSEMATGSYSPDCRFTTVGSCSCGSIDHPSLHSPRRLAIVGSLKLLFGCSVVNR